MNSISHNFHNHFIYNVIYFTHKIHSRKILRKKKKSNHYTWNNTDQNTHIPRFSLIVSVTRWRLQMSRDSRATCIHQRTSTNVYSLTPCVSRACFPRVSRNAFPLSSLGGVTGYAIVCSTSPSPRKIAVHGLRGFLSISAPDCAVKGLMAADIAYLLCGLRKRTKERAARPFERGRSMLGRVQPVPHCSHQ